LIELLAAGLALSLTAAVVGVWQVARRDRSIHGSFDDRALGLPRLQRWDNDYHPPRLQRLRSRFPRVEFSRIALALCVLMAVLATAAFYYTRVTSQDATEQEAYDLALQRIAVRRDEAAAAGDLAVAYAMLIDAGAQLDELASQPYATPDARIDQERQAIAAEMARLSGIQQLAAVQNLGSLPAPAAGVTPRLVTGGGSVYLLADAVYQIDTPRSTLVRLLQPGDLVGDQQVGPLRAISWRDDRLLVLDAMAAYLFDAARGEWVVEPLQTLQSVGYTDVTAIETFDFNLYLLDTAAGQIFKFLAGAYDTAPDNWNGTLATDDLTQAVDLAIDGHVYVLLDDGRILDFYRSNLERTIVPRVVPTLEHAAALVVHPESPYIYVLHSPDGRILRLDRDGRLVQQFTSGAPGPSGTIIPAMTGAADLVVDEETGIAYVVASNTLYLLRLPAPPAPAGQFRPR
jgi:hypothetical protein